MDIGLVLWGMLCSVELFTGYIIVSKAGMNVDAWFPLMMMMIGLVFFFMVHRERIKMKKYQVVYRGYEKYVYYGGYIVALLDCILIITGVYNNTSLTSPGILITWILPMNSITLYYSALCFDNKEFRIANKWIDYKKIKKIKVEESNRGKKKLYLQANDKEYYYADKAEKIEKILDILYSKNKQIKRID